MSGESLTRSVSEVMGCGPRLRFGLVARPSITTVPGTRSPCSERLGNGKFRFRMINGNEPGNRLRAIIVMVFTRFHVILFYTLFLVHGVARSQELPSQRIDRARQFNQLAQQRTGVLVPLYVYPTNVHTNPVFNRLIDLKRRFETVPIWVILNPASGPGKSVDANYVKAIDRLQGAGCVVLGYVTTSYGKRPPADVRGEMEQWLKLYPRIQGLFFDEMIYDDKPEAATYQAGLNAQAKSLGFWPTVANPGADTPGRYFVANAADVIVIHEGDTWPSETRIKGDYFGGYADFPPFTRAVLVHSQKDFSAGSLAMVRKYARWVYITDDRYRPNDPAPSNPWDTLSKHMETLCSELAKP